MFIVLVTFPEGHKQALGPFSVDPLTLDWADVDPNGIVPLNDAGELSDSAEIDVVSCATPNMAGPVVELPGRHGAGQVDALFTKSGLLDQPELRHHPFLVFIREAGANAVRVTLVRNAFRAAEFPRDTQLMLQWPGKVRSDFFHFTAGDLADHLQRERERREGL